MIKDIPLDYMHLICLGVMRKLLNLWSGLAKPPSKLSTRQYKELSDALECNSYNAPYEFMRRPRSLSELKRYKATEFRQFLFYTGPVVTRNICKNPDMYLNFLSACSCRSFMQPKMFEYLHWIISIIAKIFY